MKTLFTTLIALVALVGVSACNTIEGAGKDIEAGGDKIEKAAAKN
ncbi:MAG: entericidin A/B family lipoprotein [Alphaproteobacteria bacterium]|nr:entericidin A/B family lipoprotein [Alphaproteobacteria bacterium]